MRFWLTLALIASGWVGSLLLLALPRMDPPKGGWLWPIMIILAGVLWNFPRSRWPGRAVMGVVVVAFGWATVFPGSAIHDTTQKDDAGDTVQTGFGQAVIGNGAATILHGAIAVLLLAALVVSVGRVRRARPTLLQGVLGLVVFAVILAAAVPAGIGLHALSTHRVIGKAEELTRYSEPSTEGVRTQVRLGNESAWSRTNLYSAQPVGDLTVGFMSTTRSDGTSREALVGLRTSDGAELWSYRVKAGKTQDQVRSATIDPDSKMIMIRVGGSVIGLTFDGKVSYRVRLPQLDEHDNWLEIGDQLGSAAPSITIGSVAVFGRSVAGSPSGFAYGFSVATGRRLWSFQADAELCDYARAATTGEVSYLLVAGTGTGCKTELLRYDGAEQSFRVPVTMPNGHSGAGFALPTDTIQRPPSLGLVDADRVALSLAWKDHARYGLDTQVFDSGGNLIGHVPTSDNRNLNTLPIALDDDSDGTLGALRYRSTMPQDELQGGWVVFDDQLRPTGRSWFDDDAASSARYLGDLLAVVTDDQSKISLRETNADSTMIDTLDAKQVPACTAKGFSWYAGDDHALAVRCSDTTLVRPTR